jgi:hypothetical protein
MGLTSGDYKSEQDLSILIILRRVVSVWALKKEKKKVRTKPSLLKAFSESGNVSSPPKGAQNTTPRGGRWALLPRNRRNGMITHDINKAQ